MASSHGVHKSYMSGSISTNQTLGLGKASESSMLRFSLEARSNRIKRGIPLKTTFNARIAVDLHALLWKDSPRILNMVTASESHPENHNSPESARATQWVRIREVTPPHSAQQA